MTIASTQLTPPVNKLDHIRGCNSAEVTLVEYGDYACARCREATSVVQQLQIVMGDRLRFVFRNFPALTAYSNANRAAEAAEAAGVQNKFWEMHYFLYDHQSALSDKHLRGYATEVGLNMEQLNRDMLLHTFVLRVAEDIFSASRSGVSATPAFFVNGRRHYGPSNFETLLSHIFLGSLQPLNGSSTRA